MNRIFLGKPLHWGLIVALVGIGWWIGAARLHVSAFNLFIVILLVASVVAVALVIWSSRPGEPITRDPLEPGEE